MKQEREPFLRKKTGVILLRVSWGWYPTRYRFPPKPQDQLDIVSCAARTYGTWIKTLTPNYILGASSKSLCCLRKERWGLSVLWSTSCPDTRKFAFSSPNVEMAAYFPFPRFFAVYRIRFLKNAAFLTKNANKRISYTYRYGGWTPQYPICLRQSNLSEPEQNGMNWEKHGLVTTEPS